ncbi:hypothetical protein ACFWY6_03840 [Streptomyces sp. NPDC059037]|uniref:hypothetical protein n=1 Tax=Streptomyces sp. NPDC059037 TaxID=3346710 RepID=UPI00369CEF2B
MPLAAQAFGAARAGAEEHGKSGEAAMSQAMRAFTLAFTTDPTTDDEIDLGEHLLAQVDLRAATLDVRIAALLRDAGTDTGVEDRAQVLAAEISTSGLLFVQAKLALARAFHYAIRDDQAGVASRIGQLRELTREGYYAYYVDIAHFMADLPACPQRRRGHAAVTWLTGQGPTEPTLGPRVKQPEARGLPTRGRHRLRG